MDQYESRRYLQLSVNLRLFDFAEPEMQFASVIRLVYSRADGPTAMGRPPQWQAAAGPLSFEPNTLRRH
jgi:hypothetical protein